MKSLIDKLRRESDDTPDQQEPDARILFVCMGNICRSPTAHGVFQHMVEAAGLTDRVRID